MGKQGDKPDNLESSHCVHYCISIHRTAELTLKGDEEILPGIRVFWIGGHSICSQAIAVDTEQGTAVFTGDTCYIYENYEDDRPIGWADPDDCRRAMARIRTQADFIVPGHDPRVLERHPGGVIG